MSRASTLHDLHRQALRQLQAGDVETPGLDARLLVAHFTNTTQTDAIVRGDVPIDPETAAAVEKALLRRLAGEPVHRIIGHRAFHGIDLRLSPGTLEPRPDTETLVDMALTRLRALAAAGTGPRILDLGTGTGAIALALLHALPEATALGVDISGDALRTAVENAARLGLAARFEARRSDWFAAVPEKFHAIVANPPYIPSRDIASLPREVRDFDPHAALDGGADGLEPYRTIAGCVADHLEEGGFVAVEIGHDQFGAVERIFAEHGFRLGQTGLDLLGHRRAMAFSRL